MDFLPLGRREGAIAVHEILRDRCRKGGKSYISTMWDQRNVFQCPSHSKMSEKCDLHFSDPDDAKLMALRHELGYIVVECSDKTVVLKTGQGGMQGDISMPVQFNDVYKDSANTFLELAPAPYNMMPDMFGQMDLCRLSTLVKQCMPTTLPRPVLWMIQMSCEDYMLIGTHVLMCL